MWLSVCVGRCSLPSHVSRRVINNISNPQTLKPLLHLHLHPALERTSSPPPPPHIPASLQPQPNPPIPLSIPFCFYFYPYPYPDSYLLLLPSNQPTKFSIPNLYLSTYLLELYCPIQSLPCKITDSVLSETCHLELVMKARIQIQIRFRLGFRFRFRLYCNDWNL